MDPQAQANISDYPSPYCTSGRSCCRLAFHYACIRWSTWHMSLLWWAVIQWIGSRQGGIWKLALHSFQSLVASFGFPGFPGQCGASPWDNSSNLRRTSTLLLLRFFSFDDEFITDWLVRRCIWHARIYPVWMQSIFEVLEKYYGFIKATECLDATNLVVSKTMVLSKL